MISHKYNFIFIQIPKTGCTSAEQILRKYGGVSGQTGRAKGIYYKHRTYSELEESKDFKKIKDYFSFTFVRNPWDWLVSNYFYCKGVHACYRDKQNNRIPDNVPENISLEDWLYWYVENIKGTQKEMIVDSSGSVAVDFIGKLENYSSDFTRVCDILKIDRIKLPHTNKTKHKHYTEYYNNDTRKLIAEHYAEDIEHFGYKFGE